MTRILALLACCFCLSACTALGALNTASTPSNAYELRPPATTPIARSMQRTQLVIEVPSASGAIDTDRILVRPRISEVQYLPEARWTQPAPVMIQATLVETFLRTGGFQFVGQRPIGPIADLALVSHLSEFGVDIDPASGQGTVVMTLVVNIVREDDTRILASRRFTRRAQLPDTSTPAILTGFESVSAAVFTDLSRWVLRSRGIPVQG